MYRQDIQFLIKMLAKTGTDMKAWREEMAAWNEKMVAETEAIIARTRARRDKMCASHMEMVSAFKPET
jgi:hypothetical protein